MRRDVSEPALIWTGKVMLEGRVAIPGHPAAAVIFASVPALADEARDEQIIAGLYAMGVAVVYAPLLTEDEIQFDARTTHFRYDADFLAQRLIDVTQWVKKSRALQELPVGIIASSGGAAGAIVAAAMRPDLVAAVVSIDGRTDLAVDHLKNVRVPTALIVKDMPVLRMNREALAKIRGDRRIEIVHGEDAAAVENVAQKAIHWIEDKLALVPADAFGMV